MAAADRLSHQKPEAINQGVSDRIDTLCFDCSVNTEIVHIRRKAKLLYFTQVRDYCFGSLLLHDLTINCLTS